MGTHKTARMASRCKGVTRAGAPCRRPVAGDGDGYCRQHGTVAFYARVLSPEDRERYAQALAQEGLTAEVALLRLHLLHLLGRDDAGRPGEIPRTVQALARALKDNRAAAGDLLAALDSAVREEGRRWVEQGAPASDLPPQE